MHNSKHVVAFRLSVDDDAKGNDIVEVFKHAVAALELTVYRIDVFYPTFKPKSAQTFGDQRVMKDPFYPFDIVAFVDQEMFHFFGKLLILLRMEVFEAYIFEFGLHPFDPQTVGDGDINVERFLCDGRLFVRTHVLQRPHVVHAIGQLDEDATQIAVHGKQHFAEIGRLAFLFGRELIFVELGQCVDEFGNFLAEGLDDIVTRRVGILDDIVQQGRTDAGLIEFERRHEFGHAERMNDIRFSRLAALKKMFVVRIFKCTAHERTIGFRMIAHQAPDKAVIHLFDFMALLPDLFHRQACAFYPLHLLRREFDFWHLSPFSMFWSLHLARSAEPFCPALAQPPILADLAPDGDVLHYGILSLFRRG